MFPEVVCVVWGWYNTVVSLWADSVWCDFAFGLGV